MGTKDKVAAKTTKWKEHVFMTMCIKIRSQEKWSTSWMVSKKRVKNDR